MCIRHDGILPKGPYLPCVSMAGTPLLAGYPLHLVYINLCCIVFKQIIQNTSALNGKRNWKQNHCFPITLFTAIEQNIISYLFKYLYCIKTCLGCSVSCKLQSHPVQHYGDVIMGRYVCIHEIIEMDSVFSCDQAALQMVFSVCPSVCPSVRPSVCPSVHLSVTPFWLCSHHRIIMKFSGVITNDRCKVHAKGQGQRSKVKVTEVTTQLNRFRTVTPVWIHIWWWNDAYSLM